MIYVECYPDKALIMSLGLSKRKIEHEFGKSRVCNKLSKATKSLGLVDEDPETTQPSYMLNLHKHIDVPSYSVFCDKVRDNQVIVLKPKLEGFIIKVTKEAGIKLSDYNLPDETKELHDAISRRMENKNYLRLLAELNDKSQTVIRIRKIIIKSI
ncbi:hypothetical protein HY768_05180 [candidate division TA06 bacterium]|uniref:Uncharacterized protein n=1 Tax=candidate division TA06 bacterium TaxID=2250710 RepID=A0A933MHZ9_UNCT6|nr:hypothetical protein [candidate division TA06 bacterium]